MEDSISRIFQTIPAPAILSSLREGRCIDVNESCLSLLGYRRKEMIGRTAAELSLWEKPEARAPLIRKLRRQGYLRKEPVTLQTKSGEIRHALWSAQVLELGGEDVMLSLFYDITELKRMEARLGSSLKKYQDIFENIQDLYYETGIDGIILELSPSLERLSKWKRKDLIGKSIYGMYVNPEERAELIKTIQEKGFITDYEITLKDKDRKVISCSINARLIHDEKGAPLKIIGSMRDISGRKKMEEQLRESEEKYRSVIDHIGIAVALISPRMEILAINNQMRQWYPHIDPSRKPICYKTFNHPPRKRVCSYCPTYRTLQDGETHEAVTETPLGGAVKNFRIISTPIKDPSGSVVAAIEMVEDITEKKLMQEQLRESEEWYRTIFETTASATMVIEEDTIVSFVNKAFEEGIGYSKEDVEGKKSWKDFVPEEDRAVMKEYHQLRRVSPSAAPGSYETRFLDREGNIRDVLATVAMIPGTKKSVASLTDITDRKHAERSLKEREEELSIKSRNLEELNAALKILLRQRDEDRTELEEKVLANVKTRIVPCIERLKEGPLDHRQSASLVSLEKHLQEIISPFLHRVSQAYFDLTPQEIQVAGFVKDGMTTKEIAERLGVSARTVDTHRDSIRKKLGIKNRQTSLRSFLLKFS
jgi:PAS domain S-box-containing protein